jgi:hypothetical protein
MHYYHPSPTVPLVMKPALIACSVNSSLKAGWAMEIRALARCQLLVDERGEATDSTVIDPHATLYQSGGLFGGDELAPVFFKVIHKFLLIPPHLNPLPQGERKRVREWIPAGVYPVPRYEEGMTEWR